MASDEESVDFSLASQEELSDDETATTSDFDFVVEDSGDEEELAAARRHYQRWCNSFDKSVEDPVPPQLPPPQADASCDTSSTSENAVLEPVTQGRRSLQYRDWVFTYFARDCSDGFAKHFGTDLARNCKYVVFQTEKCPTTGKLHFQGFIQFASPTRFTVVQKLIPVAHWFRRKGTVDQAIAYCKKEETRVSGPFEFGTPPQQGKRNDLDDVVELVASGASFRDVVKAAPKVVLKYPRGVRTLLSFQPEPKRTCPQVWIYYGPTGCGKTSLARTISDDFWMKPVGGSWMDGYFGQKVAIIDEVGHDQLNVYWTLRVMDRYPLQVEVKGDYVWFTADILIFTSNLLPQHWWSWQDVTVQKRQPNTMNHASWAAFVRRVTKVVVWHATAPGALSLWRQEDLIGQQKDDWLNKF